MLTVATGEEQLAEPNFALVVGFIVCVEVHGWTRRGYHRVQHIFLRWEICTDLQPSLEFVGRICLSKVDLHEECFAR